MKTVKAAIIVLFILITVSLFNTRTSFAATCSAYGGYLTYSSCSGGYTPMSSDDSSNYMTCCVSIPRLCSVYYGGVLANPPHSPESCIVYNNGGRTARMPDRSFCCILPTNTTLSCSAWGGYCVYSTYPAPRPNCPAGTTTYPNYDTAGGPGDCLPFTTGNPVQSNCCKGPPAPPPPPRYDINGYVWIDKNRDGSKQGSEPYYTDNLTVRLSGAASATTDVAVGTPGPYAFFNYLAGNYTVSITPPANYDATTSTSQSFYLNADRFNVNFGIVPYYSISGNVFNDLNKDRVKDLIDPDTNPVMEPNITSGINITTSGTAAGGTLSVNSAAGTFSITHLYEAQYTVSYTTSPLPAGYFLIYPLTGPPPQFRIYVGTNCYQNVNLSFGSSCYGMDNGNVQNVNFAISNSIPWFQTYGLNMRLDEGFEDKIPSSPLYPAYASVADNANGTGYLITPTPTYTPTPTNTPVPPTPTPTNVPGVGAGCNAAGRTGTCLDRNRTSCPTYYDAGNYCPGGNSVQCCVTNQVACRSTGRCHNRYANDGGNIYPCSQTWYSGYCPGPFDVQCCAP